MYIYHTLIRCTMYLCVYIYIYIYTGNKYSYITHHISTITPRRYARVREWGRFPIPSVLWFPFPCLGLVAAICYLWWFIALNDVYERFFSLNKLQAFTHTYTPAYIHTCMCRKTFYVTVLYKNISYIHTQIKKQIHTYIHTYIYLLQKSRPNLTQYFLCVQVLFKRQIQTVGCLTQR